MAKTLYFAYGSNLSLTQMASRCPTSTYHALAALHGWKWIIGERGYANVIPSPSSNSTSHLRGKPQPPSGLDEDYVVGMLYYMEPDDEEKLDRAEGVPDCYAKEMLEVEVLDGKGEGTGQWVQGLVYVDVVRTGTGVCREEYVGRLNRGLVDAEKVGMTRGYVEKYLRPFVREEEVPGEVEDPFHPSKIVSS